ncbi:MAG: hypothetical protein GY940_22550, partial [bacterium]|nr:hypothetical protein [bacterium]
GQEPPGMTPEVFAPGIISTNRHEGCSGFTKDGNLFIFNRHKHGILIMEKKNGIWGPPYPAPFSAKDHDWDFMVAPGGDKIFIAAGRTLTKDAQPTRNHNIWVVERTSSGWSQPRPLEYPVNTDWHESYPSVSRDGTLYFFKRFKDPEGKADIYRSKLVNGKYTKIEKLGGKINTEYNDLDAF